MATVIVAPMACGLDQGNKYADWQRSTFMRNGDHQAIEGTTERTPGSTTDDEDSPTASESCELVTQGSWMSSSSSKSLETYVDQGLQFADGEQPLRRLVRRNKLAFVLGSANLCLIFYWLGSSKSTFYQLYTAESLILFSVRWVTFKREKKHYYMFDFCYAVNALLLAFLWIWPQCLRLHKVLFAYNAGPLAWSIVVFQNSVVFHSVYEWTSLFLHWYPMLVSWTLRWDQDSCSVYSTCDLLGAKWWQWTNVVERWNWSDVFDLTILPMAPYFIWASLYYLKIFVISSKRIEQRGYETLYKYMTGSDGMCGRVMHRFPTQFQPLIYMVFHSMLCWSTMSASIIFWYFPWVHTGLILLTTGMSFWNGASHYLEASITSDKCPPTRKTSVDAAASTDRKCSADDRATVLGGIVAQGADLVVSYKKPKCT